MAISCMERAVEWRVTFGPVADFIEQHAATVDDEFAPVEVFGIGRFPLQEAEVVGAYGVPLLGTEGAVVVLAHEGDFVGREGVEYLVTELGGDGEDGELQVRRGFAIEHYLPGEDEDDAADCKAVLLLVDEELHFALQAEDEFAAIHAVRMDGKAGTAAGEV